MTWQEAIKKVLAEEGAPMHYSDITNKIIEKGYRKRSEMGYTPEMTVNAQLSTKKEVFEKLGGGLYALKGTPAPVATTATKPAKKSKKEDPKETEVALQRNNIIKNFGMFWSRDDVNWKNLNMWGTQNGSTSKVNFKGQIGIYMLHDAREVVYVGQAVKQSIAKRLSDHCKDRLNGRWDRFSWFGFYGVNEKGELITNDFDNNVFTLENVANAFEAILIEGMEPRQNRKSGNEFGYEFIQAKDDEMLELDQSMALIKKLLKK